MRTRRLKRRMLASMRAALACLLLLGCAATPVADLPRAPADVAVYVVPQGGHTGLAVRMSDIPAPLVPEKRDFPGADYLEIGWGERDFYMAPSAGPWLSFKAGVFPNRSVVHLVGVRGELARAFPASEIVAIPLSRPALEGLLRYVHDAFEREDGTAVALGRGFYPGRETFYVLRTCNVWTAGALRAAGLPVRNALTVEGILAQVRLLSPRPAP